MICNNKFKYLVFFVLGILVSGIWFVFVDKSDFTNVLVHDNEINTGINNVYDSVVYIANYKDKKLSSSGTGFVYKKENGKGYILTNYHVVNGNTNLSVRFSNDKDVEAKFIGGDNYLDIAIITVPEKEVLQVAKLNSSESLVLGDTVFTVGSPVGDDYRGTVTRGILSGKDRFVSVAVNGGAEDYVMKLIQTDAAMNPGNSGGPLCNINGEVIGINSLKLVKNEVEGMGFAIPISDVLVHVDSFEKGEKIKRPYLGIAVINLSNESAVKYYGLDKVKTKLEKGVIIESVEEGSSADGYLKKGDIIVKVGGEKVSDMAYFRYELFRHKVGEKTTFTVERNGILKDVTIFLREK